MHRFFASSEDIHENRIILSADNQKHLRVLRLQRNEHFIVCDGNSVDYICKHNEQGEGFAEIVAQRVTQGEPKIKCSVYLAYAKGDRLDYAVQKSVELGACAIILFPAKRCISVPVNLTSKLMRLQKIALEAAKQCGRGIVPQVTSENSFESAIKNAATCDLSLFCYESEAENGIVSALNAAKIQGKCLNTISIITGPEGGFEEREAALALNSGCRVCTLGTRILRCETAPIVALTIIMHRFDYM